jgi:hypothetical protein
MPVAELIPDNLVAATALIGWEYFLTLDDEVRPLESFKCTVYVTDRQHRYLGEILLGSLASKPVIDITNSCVVSVQRMDMV